MSKSSSMNSYVHVLYNMSKDDSDFLESVAELEEFHRVFWGDHLLVDFLCSPAVDRSLREKMLRSAFESAQMNELVTKLVVLMLRKNVILNFPKFILALRDFADDTCNIARGYVYTAVKLTEPAKKKVLTALSAWTKKTAEIEFVHQPEILGGLKVKLKNLVLDTSLDGKLSKAKSTLKNKRA